MCTVFNILLFSLFWLTKKIINWPDITYTKETDQKYMDAVKSYSIILKEKTVSGWIEENGPPFFPQILNCEWLGHLPMKIKVPRKWSICRWNRNSTIFPLANGAAIRGSKSEFEEKRGTIFLDPTTNCLFL